MGNVTSNVTGNVTWIKINVDIFDVGKMPVIASMPNGATFELLWVKLLTLAGQSNNGGSLYIANSIPFDKKSLAIRCKVKEKIMENALEIFKNFGMVEEENGVLQIKNWAKYQNVDGMEKVREQGRKRVSAYRERQKEQKSNVDVTLHSNADVTLPVTLRNAIEEEKEEEKDIEENIEKENFIKENDNGWMDELEKPKKKRTVFKPPTVDEVREYCESRSNGIDAEYFVNYYTTRNWVLTKGVKMSDWKAAVRTWESNNKKNGWKKTINSVEDVAKIQHRNPFAEMAQRGEGT